MPLMFSKIRSVAEAAGRPPAAIEIAPEGVLAAARPAARPRRGASRARLRAMSCKLSRFHPGAIGSPASTEPQAPGARKPSPPRFAPPRRNLATHAPLPLSFADFSRPRPASSTSITSRHKPSEAIPVVRCRCGDGSALKWSTLASATVVLSQTEAEWKSSRRRRPNGPILAEYEAAVRSADLRARSYLSSSLAALESFESMEAIMAANLSAHAVTTTIATGQELLLYRTLDLPQDPAQRVAEIQRGIAVASAYFEDKLGSRPRTLHYAGVQDPAEFAASIGDPDLTVVEWASRPEEGAMTALPQTCCSRWRRGAWPSEWTEGSRSRSISPHAPMPTSAPRSSACALPWLRSLRSVSSFSWASISSTARPTRPALRNTPSTLGSPAWQPAERSTAVTMMHRPENAQVLLIQAQALGEVVHGCKSTFLTLAMEAMRRLFFPPACKSPPSSLSARPTVTLLVHVRVVGLATKQDKFSLPILSNPADFFSNAHHRRKRIVQQPSSLTPGPHQHFQSLRLRSPRRNTIRPICFEEQVANARRIRRSDRRTSPTSEFVHSLGCYNPKHLRRNPAIPQAQRPSASYKRPSQGSVPNEARTELLQPSRSGLSLLRSHGISRAPRFCSILAAFLAVRLRIRLGRDEQPFHRGPRRQADLN